jgi:hypothetical protein
MTDDELLRLIQIAVNEAGPRNLCSQNLSSLPSVARYC